jgi:hypothetical protein
VTTTPEFLRWAIERPCPLRDCDDWADPERTERQLRPLRACSEALAEGRLFEGVCVHSAVDRPCSPSLSPAEATGFRAVEIFSAYGGEEYVRSLCGSCPANSFQVKQLEPHAIAGCFGLLELDGLGPSLHQTIEAVLDEQQLTAQFDDAFLQTRPRWYGLWSSSPPNGLQRRLLLQLFGSLAERNAVLASQIATFTTALETSLRSDLPLHITLTPRGSVENYKWVLPPHCSRCKAVWPASGNRCAACGQIGRQLSLRRRHLAGQRPYWRLDGFLGKENVLGFLQRYRRHRQTLPKQDESEL